MALVALAKERCLPIVLEDLDFAAKKRSLRYEEGSRAKALSGFAYRKLIESVRARATAGFPEGLPPSPDPNGSEGREAAARGPSRPRSAKLKPVRILTD